MRDRYLLNARGYQLASYELLPLLGLKSTSPIPKDFTATREIDGVTVRIIAPPKEGRRKHRVIATCPECGKSVPAGRLNQHAGTRVCREAA